MAKDIKSKLHCSFCGKGQQDVQKLLSGSKVYICNECVLLCAEALREEDDKGEKVAPLLIKKDFVPKKIYGILDSYVIGQQQAKKVLAVSIYNH